MKALDRIPALIDKYQSDNQKLEKDLPILKEVMGTVFKKEPELKELKSQFDSLSRQINLSLENKDQNNISKNNQIEIPKIEKPYFPMPTPIAHKSFKL